MENRKKLGYENQMDDYLKTVIDTNSIECLPEDVQAKYKISDCYCYINLNEELVNKWTNKIITTIKDIELRKADYEETHSENVWWDTDENVKVFAKDLKEYDGTTLQYVGIMPTNEDLDSYISKVTVSDINNIISNLNITAADETTLTNKVYKYGFAELRPFEVLSSGEYGGITAEYLKSFSQFSGVEFTFKKYKNSTELAEAAINDELDLYYNYYDIPTNFIDTGALTEISYYIVAHNSIDLSLSNIYGLSNQTVYVLENSYLYKLLEKLDGIELITYDETTDLKKISKKENIIILDEYTYNYYFNQLSNDYSLRHKGIIDGKYYSFRYKNDKDTLYKLFNAYSKTLDPQDMKRIGITSYNGVDRKGRIVGTIAKTLLGIIAVGIVFVCFFIKNTKKLKLNTKVKKEDRLKYIDLLTSLKNRNYYVEKVPVWNKNTVYPQACIVMDINRIKDLNDSYGHEEGDKQIMAVANVLIKTQIDNTEIMRTSGNEFLVYLVGYSEKQILSYMKKLVKAFKKLPYDFGVAMGFSMIEDDTKLIEDAFNEAMLMMRKNKNSFEDNDDK